MNVKIEITKILRGDKPTKAFANIVFDNGFVVHGVGICQNDKGRFVTFPQTSWKKDGEEITRPVCHPISSSARIEIEEALFNAYEQAKKTKTTNLKHFGGKNLCLTKSRQWLQMQ